MGFRGPFAPAPRRATLPHDRHRSGLPEPPESEWRERLRKAASEEALRLRQFALACLRATNAQDQDGWGRRVGVAEEVLRTRGIRWE